MCMYKQSAKLVKKSVNQSVLGRAYRKEMEPDKEAPQKVYTPEPITPKTPKKPVKKNVSSLQIQKDY